MYADDISDKDSEFEERSPSDSPSVTKKSVSTVGFKSGAEGGAAARPLALRATQSFTGGVESVRLCAPLQRLTVGRPPRAACPCGCLRRCSATAAAAAPFRTRQRHSLALHVVPVEVLHYHGYDFPPAQIAMFWKKDCRRFLWKGQARNRNYVEDESPLKASL